eukprot:TRINITY_DN6903_c0_g1_i11.p1 TRINITY_DN6903_c0_g1~~TRINITY_DN6903_c0_g1_i11.p1  ORF type:complete len:448 (-),score=39.58 TRINITY_DN6903_c0_g1_i11:286-1629(-)
MYLEVKVAPAKKKERVITFEEVKSLSTSTKKNLAADPSVRFTSTDKVTPKHTRQVSTTPGSRKHRELSAPSEKPAIEAIPGKTRKPKKQHKATQHNVTINLVPDTEMNYSVGAVNFIHKVDTEVDLSFEGSRYYCRSLTDISFDSDCMSEGRDSFALENYCIKAQLEDNAEDIKDCYKRVVETENELKLFERFTVVPKKGGSWRFAFAGRSIPRRGSAGEDAFYATTRSLGVADGVSGWYQYGLDSSEFSKQLMSNCKRHAMHQAGSSFSTHIDLMTVLAESYAETHPIGSSTATLVAINDDALHGLNLGDSGFICFTKRGENYVCHGVTKERQHNFNTPFQLSNIPNEEDIKELRKSLPESDLKQLINTIARHDMCQDPPSSADRYILDLHEDDIVILGTDGSLSVTPRLFRQPVQERDKGDSERGHARSPKSRRCNGKGALAHNL